MNMEKRKQSEDFTRRMADEFVKADSHLTFAEWCYRQGEADMLKVFLCGFKEGLSDYATQPSCETEIRADERAKTVDECKKIVMAECTTTCEYPFSPNCVECMTNEMEQLKEQTNV